MPGGPRWPRRGVLALAAAAVALATLTSDPGAGQGAPAPAAPAPAASAVPGVAPEPLRIMPLGSSSTVGTGSSATAGFRGPLESLLERDRIAYDMVGSQHSGPAWLADRDHEGHGGATMAQMQPRVADWVSRQRPDVILLQVGTNDIIAGAGAAATAQRLDTMLSTIRAVSDAHVIVAGVWAPLPTHAQARAQYARLAPAVVARHRAAGGSATFLDTSALLTTGDLFDGLHPNVAGYRKIARIWARGIRAHLLDGGADRLAGAPTVDAVVGFRPSWPVDRTGRPVPAVSNASSASGPAPASRPHRLTAAVVDTRREAGPKRVR